jgi:hypothetical protein
MKISPHFCSIQTPTTFSKTKALTPSFLLFYYRVFVIRIYFGESIISKFIQLFYSKENCYEVTSTSLPLPLPTCSHAKRPKVSCLLPPITFSIKKFIPSFQRTAARTLVFVTNTSSFYGADRLSTEKRIGAQSFFSKK